MYIFKDVLNCFSLFLEYVCNFFLIMRDYNGSKSISTKFPKLRVQCANNQKLNEYLSLVISK